MSYKFLTCVIDKSGLATVTLNRPDVHNAFHDGLIAELTGVFEMLSKDAGVRVVLLTGEGKSFSAGADLHWMKSMKGYSREENRQDALKMARMFEHMHRCTKPILAKVRGNALGGGAGLVAVCDYVMADADARFGFTEVRLGLVPAVISPYVIAKIGESHARAWFLSGGVFGANLAQMMGLVHEVVPADALDMTAQLRVREFLKAAPQAARHAKELIYKTVRGGPVADADKEEKLAEDNATLIASLRTGNEGQEGMGALLEKRKPKWQAGEG